MLHAVVERVRTRLLDRLPPTRSYTLTTLGQAGLPGPVAHFIAQMLQRRLEAEVQALSDARSAWFDHADADVQEAYERYIETLSEHALVPAEEWTRTLSQAVEQVVPFLVQPARTLGAFVFPEGRDVLPAAVVLRRMRYFNAYPYLNDVIAAYVQRKGLEEVDRATFVPLLHRIEHRTPDEYAPAGWVTLLRPLFYAVGEGTPPRVAPDLLARFFEDKGVRAVAERLRQQREPLAGADLEALLEMAAPSPAAPSPAAPEQAAPVSPAEPAPAAAPPGADRRPASPDAPALPAPPPPTPRSVPPPPVLAASPSPPAAAPAAAPPAAPHRPPPAPPAQAVPLWQQFQRGTPAATPPAAPSGAPPTVGQRAEARAAAPLWQRFRRHDAPAAAEPGAEPDTLDRLERHVLGQGARAHRPHFVRVLFSGSPDAYRSLLEKLRDAQSWAEASHLIAESFRQHHVNIYQDAAVAFTDAAEARFS